MSNTQDWTQPLSFISDETLIKAFEDEEGNAQLLGFICWEDPVWYGTCEKRFQFLKPSEKESTPTVLVP